MHKKIIILSLSNIPKKKLYAIAGGSVILILLLFVLFSGGHNHTPTYASAPIHNVPTNAHSETIKDFTHNNSVYLPENLLMDNFQGEITIPGPYIITFSQRNFIYVETRTYPYLSIATITLVKKVPASLISAAFFTKTDRNFSLNNNTLVYSGYSEQITIYGSTVIVTHIEPTLKYTATFTISSPKNYFIIGTIG